METVEFAPFRSFEDFFGKGSRYQLPNINRQDRWSNRVINNLIYYQSNYFLVFLVTMIIFLFLHPLKYLIGFIIVALVYLGFLYVSNSTTQAQRFKRDHPLVFVGAILITAYIFIALIGAILVFVVSIIIPVACVFAHASLRMRNMKNKISRQMEYIGLKRTPMGLFLESVGQEQEAGT